MNAEKLKIIWNNIKKHEFLGMDIVNLFLGIAVIFCAILALSGVGGYLMHILVFFFGFFLMLLNMLKNIKRRSVMAVTFGLFALITLIVMGSLFYLWL